MIVFTSRTTTKVSRVARPVCCANCKTEYVYWDRLESEATSFGVYGAHADKSDQLAADQEKKQHSHFTPVPCPKCLLYPTYMTRRVGNPAAGPWATGTKLSFYAALLCGIGSLITWCAVGGDVALLVGAVAALFVVLMIGSLIGGIASNVGYDANNEKDEGARKKVAKEKAMTRAEFEAGHLRDAEKSLADRLATADEDPRARLDPVPVLFWHGVTGNDPLTNRAVTLPGGEVFRFDLPNDTEEYDEFDLKRTVNGERIVFRVQVRFYYPTHLSREDRKQVEMEQKERGQAEMKQKERQQDWFEEEQKP